MDLDIDRELTRRGALAGVLGAGVAAGFLSPVSTFLRQFAPLSGSVWKPARAGMQSTVDSPHGPAEVRYDDWGVPQISADDEQALYFAVGYVHGRDRLFQLDLQRRLVSGTLSEVVGDATLDSDRFNRQMRFRKAAKATVDHLEGTKITEPVTAYVDGVNAAMENEPLPMEFQLLDYEPEPWTKVDSITIEKLIAWGLSGGFRTLRKNRLREEFGEEMAQQAFPFRYGTEDPIIRDHHDPGAFGANLDSPGTPGEEGTATVDPGSEMTGHPGSVGPELVDWLGQFEPARQLGSNSWLVGPELAAGDAPLVSNDPHLQLQAAPIWQEAHLDGPDHRVRGVMFPGVPFVVIGENDHGAWGFTNTPTDVIDYYSYDSDGDSYQYDGESREFEIEADEIEVSGGENEQLELKRSVHGPVIEEQGQEVGVTWTGHAATETSLAIYELTHSEGVDEALAAAEKWEAPPQNFVYGDRDGNTRYQVLGRFPIRRVDGETVRGNQVFDGSNPGWEKFEPFERPTAWEEDESGDENPAFVPFAENPHVENPDYIGTANQLIADDDRINYYLGWEYTSTYRSRRLYEMLDEAEGSDEPIDLDTLREIGQDTFDSRAAQVVPENEDGSDGPSLVAAARASDDDDLVAAADTLAEWDHRMTVDSEAALIFDRWVQAYWDELFEDALDEAGIEDEYDPPDQAVVELPPDSGWFGPEGREATMRRALRTALDTIDDEGWEVYGDVSTTSAIEHPLHSGAPFLSYPDHPRAGSEHTLQNFDYHEPWGSSWMMQVDLQEGGEYLGLLAGGNSGRYFSEHYTDQVSRWADANYRSLAREIEGNLAITMEEEG
jgi:penicillin amidase